MKSRKKGVISFSDYTKNDSKDIENLDDSLSFDGYIEENKQDAEQNNAQSQETISAGSGSKRIPRHIYVIAKKYLKLLLRLLIVLAIAAIIIVIYVNRENLSAQGISDWAKETFTGEGRGDGYPVTVSGTNIMDIRPSGKNITVLTDTSVVSYDKFGKQLFSRQHTVGTPAMRTGAKTALVYDRGGTVLTVENKSGIQTQINTDYKLLCGDINEQGVFAYASKSEGGYMSEVHVFNKNYQEIYKAYQSKYLISDIAVSDDGKFVATLLMGAVDGGYYSGIRIYDLSSDIPISIDIYETLILDINWCGDYITAVGSDYIAYYDMFGNEIEKYTFTDRLVTYCFDDNYSCIVLDDNMNDEYSVVFLDSAGTFLCDADIPAVTEQIRIYDNMLYALTDSELIQYDTTGDVINQWLTSGNSSRFAICDGYAYITNRMSVQSIRLS